MGNTKQPLATHSAGRPRAPGALRMLLSLVIGTAGVVGSLLLCLVLLGAWARSGPQQRIVPDANQLESARRSRDIHFDASRSEHVPRIVVDEDSGAVAGSAPTPTNAGRRLPALPWLAAGAALLFVLLWAFRHPFVARRLLTLVPTLLVMSIVVFVAVELPPGDFATSRMLELSQTGDANVQQIEEPRSSHHFDESAPLRYLRWLGVLWFTSFDSADRGLLQGYLGRAMASNRPVAEVVGDRAALTILISVATVFFTWLIAVPVGIYSAVRRHTLVEHVLTFTAFLAMSVPPFLLALVLMVVVGVSGLFSPQFASQTHWDLAKLVDLAQHIWLPILVLSLATAGSLSRVLRANLLDELGKPYVITARARGLSPLRVLLKYPVRVALNPLISSLGQSFPQLISGGVLVAIVLGLPTLGPLQVRALFAEDTPLAAAVLMMLGLLSVLGTLMADLALLWLDPRIRFEQQEAR